MLSDASNQLQSLVSVYQHKKLRVETACRKAVRQHEQSQEELNRLENQHGDAVTEYREVSEQWQQETREAPQSKEKLMEMRYVLHNIQEKINDMDQKVCEQKEVVIEKKSERQKHEQTMRTLVKKIEKLQLLMDQF